MGGGGPKIPVYSTENGEYSLGSLWDAYMGVVVTGFDLRKIKSSLTRSLCEQIFSLPIHWTKATNFSEAVTHAIDFGPGSLSGIEPMTARNFDGQRIRVIVVGQKGDTGLYSSSGITYKEWWNKRRSPKLVRT